MPNLVSITDLSDDDIGTILAGVGRRHDLAGRIICSAFFEPSTRTRLSFETAAYRCGANVIGFADQAATSTSKGETLEDTIRVLAGYADAVVLRHPEVGAATRAAAVSPVPIVNAGDGAGEHPSQALLDVSFLQQELGDLAGTTIAVAGDLRHGRTVHSLVPLLGRLGARVVQVPAADLALPAPWHDTPIVGMAAALADADAVYLTRVQEERFADPALYRSAKAAIHVTRDALRDADAPLLLHPLPRREELHPSVDQHPSAKYFDQAHHGALVRQSILAWCLGAWP